jgi:hypothetical protein
LTAERINFSIGDGQEKDEAERNKTVGLTVSEELLHNLGEVRQGNAIFVAVHELKDVVEFDIVQLAAVEIEDTILQLLPRNEACFLCIILVEDLRNRRLVSRAH